MRRLSCTMLVLLFSVLIGGCAQSGVTRGIDGTAPAGQASTPKWAYDLRAEEQRIRALIAKQGTPDAAKQTDDVIFVSGAYARPVVGPRDDVTPRADARMDQRLNVKADIRIQRIEVAQAGDMAYEYSDFTQSYDVADTKEHRSFEGSVLRVWKKVGGEWRIAAMFARPNEK
jgi:ketosteroid isomerase-like protein